MYNLKYYLDAFSNSCRYPLVNALLKEVEIYGVDAELDICYLKNMYIDGVNPILYVFTEVKILKFTVDNDKDFNVTVNIFNRCDVKNISYTHAIYDDEYSVSFNVGDENIKIDPNTDTKINHSVRYHRAIPTIINYLKK